MPYIVHSITSFGIKGKIYYKDKENQIYHREDGPAIEWEDGERYWFVNGIRHREDGPAVEYLPTKDLHHYKSYWLNGKEYTEKDYWATIRFGGFV